MSLNSYIDHTLLRPDASKNDIQKLCEEAVHFQFAAVCVNPTWIAYAHTLLKSSSVKLCSVGGFPLGANTSEVKASEARQLVQMGVDEIDRVINIGALKSGNYHLVREDIESVVIASRPRIVKVIIETCLLTDEEKEIASTICVDAGARFVKTSTGFSKHGATVHDIALIRKIVGPDFGIKASGGISDKKFALELIQAGATRIGTSRGVAMMGEV